MVFETIAVADFAIRARSQPTMAAMRRRQLVVLLVVAGAALAYRQYRLAQAPDPAVHDS